jgi:hypothetical protein
MIRTSASKIPGVAASALIALSSFSIPVSAQTTATPATAPAADKDKEESIVMSPFTVDASKDKGYYSENTLAGSRLNTRVADLGASITVVTKQQLVDTASLDLNDVFLYEANTEGANNYTDFNIDTRGAVQDRNAGFQGGAPSLPFGPSTSNRVRGTTPSRWRSTAAPTRSSSVSAARRVS